MSKITIASIEYNPKFPDLERNIAGLIVLVEEAAKNNAKLIALPEVATLGAIPEDLSLLSQILDTIPGITTSKLEQITKKYKCYVVLGIAEIDHETGLIYNSAALVGPEGYIGKYRKTQLNPIDSLFFARGNLGFPVFETEIGRIGIIVCYDDVYLQTMLLLNLRQIDILVLVASAFQVPASYADHDINHSTIANITNMSGWLGTYILAANRAQEVGHDSEEVLHASGGASIWNVDGQLIAKASVIGWLDSDDTSIVYGEINQQNYQNEIKKYWLEHRRPELYYDYASFRFQRDNNKSKVETTILALLVQYSPEYGNKIANYNKIRELIFLTKQTFNLLILPFNSLIGGEVESLVDAKKLAEPINGDTKNKMIDLAKKTRSFVVYSMVELGADDKIYLTAIMLSPQGEIVGIYRKSHLNSCEQLWATAGNDLPVFKTYLGNIAIALSDEVRIPEITDIYAIKRADIIIIPTDYCNNQYGGPVRTPKHLLVFDCSDQAMFIWYNMAKYSQTYVLVANYAKEKNLFGSSGLYYPDPEMGFYPPDLIDNSNRQQAFLVAFHKKPAHLNWIYQELLISGRRDTLATPLLLPKDNKLLVKWQDNPQEILFS